MPNKTLTLAHTGKLKQEKRGVLLEGELKPATAAEREAMRNVVTRLLGGMPDCQARREREFVLRLLADRDLLESRAMEALAAIRSLRGSGYSLEVVFGMDAVKRLSDLLPEVVDADKD